MTKSVNNFRTAQAGKWKVIKQHITPMAGLQKPITIMTTTNELYLPTRLVYEIYDVKQLAAWLRKASIMTWNPMKQGWTWDFRGATRKMDFPLAYRQVPKKYQPIVLASCYLVDDHTFHVYTRCGFRTAKFLVFFDQQVSRSTAMGKFIDQYNLVTSVSPGDPIPTPEDYFQDESQIEFIDLIALLDQPDSPAKKQALTDHMANMTKRTLRPLERHRLDGFYQDGPELMEQTMRYRDMLAMLQHRSDKPILPLEVMTRILSGKEDLLSDAK